MKNKQNNLLNQYLELNIDIFLKNIWKKDKYILVKSFVMSKYYNQFLVTKSNINEHELKSYVEKIENNFTVSIPENEDFKDILNMFLQAGMHILDQENWLIMDLDKFSQINIYKNNAVHESDIAVIKVDKDNFFEFQELIKKYYNKENKRFPDKFVEICKKIIFQELDKKMKKNQRNFEIYMLMINKKIIACNGLLYSLEHKFGQLVFGFSLDSYEKRYEHLVDFVIKKAYDLKLKQLLSFAFGNLKNYEYLLKKGFQLDSVRINLGRKFST